MCGKISKFMIVYIVALSFFVFAVCCSQFDLFKGIREKKTDIDEMSHEQPNQLLNEVDLSDFDTSKVTIIITWMNLVIFNEIEYLSNFIKNQLKNNLYLLLLIMIN